jgi:hypothetical protein
VIAAGETGKTFTIETNSTAIVPTSIATTDESMITNLDAERSVKDATNGIYLWTVTFDVSANTATSARSATISINIGGITKTINVSQLAMSVYVNDPIPALFNDVAVGGATDNLFTIETNAPDANITVNCPEWITIKAKSRSTVAADGSSTWTISFDVSANTTTSVRSGSIEVTIGGIKKTVTVSQIALYVGEPSQTSFPDLPVGGETGQTFTITTNTPDESITVNCPEWITNLTKSRSAVAADGSYTWTISFDVSANTTTVPRSGNIEVTIGGIKKTVTVSQVAVAAVFVNAPIPANIPDVIAAGAIGKTFTITTNVQDNDIIVTTTNPSLITNLIPSRSAVAADGSSTWTISFDVTENTTTSARTGNIEVTIGGQKKTVSVSQVGVYVNNPVPASFDDLAVGGETGKTFTITTNTPDESITVNCPEWITIQTKSRSAVAADGSSTWTIGFDVSANTTTSARTGNIEVTIGGQKKTIPVSQVTVSIYIYEPNPLSFVSLVAAGVKDNQFTIETNSLSESITVNCPEWITIQTKTRSAGAADGSFIWTISFDVVENIITSTRSGNIEVILSGHKKTVYVSQVAAPLYVHAPNPSSFLNLAAVGARDNLFTIETNSLIELVINCPEWITIKTKSRAVAADGSSIWTVVFDVSPNWTLSPRSAAISITISGITHAVSVGQDAATWSPPVDANDGLANCYMIAPGGTTTIPITRAITIGGMDASSTATVETLWDDPGVISGSPTLSGSGASRYITVQTSSNQGNAVIALRDPFGTIYWSWHIWVVNYDPNTGGTWTNPNNTAYTFMDRNLGATDNQLNLASWGLLYQWGRKDPFPGGVQGTAGYNAFKYRSLGYVKVTDTSNTVAGAAAGIWESIRKPVTFFKAAGNSWLPYFISTLWDTSTNSKTVYDPCPMGWRVPRYVARDNHPWIGFVGQIWFRDCDCGGLNYGEFSKWPAAGLRDSSRGYTAAGTDDIYMHSTDMTFNAYFLSYIYMSSHWDDGASVRCVRE